MARSSAARWRTGPPLPPPKREQPKQEENYEYGNATEDAIDAEMECELTAADRRLLLRRSSMKSASREDALKFPRMLSSLAAGTMPYSKAAPTRSIKRRRGGGGGDAQEKADEDGNRGNTWAATKVPQETVRKRGTKRVRSRRGQAGGGCRAARRSHHHHHQLDQFEENGGHAGVFILTNDPENDENANANNNPIHNANGVDEYGEEDDDGGDYVIPYGNDDYDDDDLGGGHDDGDDVDATY